MVLVVPALIDQAMRLAAAAPGYIDAALASVERLRMRVADDPTPGGDMLHNAFSSALSQIDQKLVSLLQGLFSGGLALVNFLALAIITPVVTFYLLLDWDNMVAAIDHWLPRRHAPTIRRIATDVDSVLAGFVRGQFTVCLILGTFYAVALALLGLDFGLIVGLFAGLISFIPFVGSLTGGALSIGIALFQFWDAPLMIVAVASVFLIGQAVEGNFLTPKLVGDSVGLHPVWLMMALSAFGALFGFVGLLVAVPAAAAIGVLIRFGLEQYKAGRLYAGGEPLEPDDPDGLRDGLGKAKRSDAGREPAE
jgi:predicted PurR-regulated permease PerM